ncbi:tRNA uridine-5-carboxymethylaminomethyl(34) synthesis enzyme MnmG [archaeon]|nr:MAG: tRNA uridine-5-carboxymethylaminomethyl(34) synthesis enzyme MnmG [archaeon]
MGISSRSDVIVIGGGHAGCEAACSSARTGAKTVLITQRFDSLGEMSCNPSIGGIGKGHLVREIDALDGIMGRIIDDAGIHYKMLNIRKGPAVRGPRAQADRDLYKAEMQSLLKTYPNLEVVEASAEDLILTNNMKTVTGVKTQSGQELLALSVVITTGTFLRGKCYLGKTVMAAGRHMRSSEDLEPPSIGLALTLERLLFPLGRLKTGTPPRLNGKTIDWDKLEKQPSDLPPPPFSYLNIDRGVKLKDKLIECAKTYTNAETHRLVMEHQHRLPDYDGAEGAGVGPRYCPSLFKKVQRFPDRDRHIIWLEPEGLNTDLVYPNGLSGPFPLEIQEKIVRSIHGLKHCEIVKPGYDVEYDYVDPRSLQHTLETKQVKGLFLAGQICGTTGYEEAAAQGIIAGANAGLHATQRPSLTLSRDEGYIGVLIDDLVTKGTGEPYRMFTSRAEYRLSLRQDNADLRLTRKGIAAGIVGQERQQAIQERESLVSKAMGTMSSFFLPRLEWATHGEEFLMSQKEGRHKSAVDVLSMPDVTLDRIARIMRQKGEQLGDAELAHFNVSSMVRDTVEATCKYHFYLSRQEDEMARWKRNTLVTLPEDMVYSHDIFPSFSAEEIETLNRHRPATIHAASQLQGITPHAIIYLQNYILKRRHRGRSTAVESDEGGSEIFAV